jgi:hypothetical protein
MLRRRWILLWLALVVVGGSLSATLGYGLYLRSDAYARATAEALSAFLGLPSEVGSVVPLDLHSRDLRDVVVWLPGKRGRVFHGRHNIWQPKRGSDPPGYELRISGGSFLVDSQAWGAEDYRLVLESGLGHDFAALRLRQIEMLDLDLTWRARRFRLATRQANGTVILSEDGTGQASLLTRWLNDQPVSEPIHIYARFRPRDGVRIEQVTLDTPRIPLSALGLEEMLGTPEARGDFRGKISYREEGASQAVELSGFVDGLRLEDLAGVLPIRSLRGCVDVQIDDGLIRDGRLERLAFRGRIDDVDLGPLAAALKLPDVGGRATLFVHRGQINQDVVSWLGLSGSVEGVSLEALSEAVGLGGVTGSLRIEVSRLVIAHNRIESGEFLITAEPPNDGPGWISRGLLLNVIEQFAGLKLPEFMPERMEYTQLGARVVVDGETFRILGTHGARNTTILTVRILGREVGLLYQPARTFDLAPVLEWIRSQAKQIKPQELRNWWETSPTFGLGTPP